MQAPDSQREIEITPEMIAAGLRVLSYSGFSEGSLGDADGLLLAEMYRAMVLCPSSNDEAC